MLSNALALYWALLLMAGRSATVEAQAPAGCDSEGELLSNLDWLKRSCPHEAFADGFTPVPQSITTVGCADVARRVAEAYYHSRESLGFPVLAEAANG